MLNKTPKSISRNNEFIILQINNKKINWTHLQRSIEQSKCCFVGTQYNYFNDYTKNLSRKHL